MSDCVIDWRIDTHTDFYLFSPTLTVHYDWLGEQDSEVVGDWLYSCMADWLSDTHAIQYTFSHQLTYLHVLAHTYSLETSTGDLAGLGRGSI